MIRTNRRQFLAGMAGLAAWQLLSSPLARPAVARLAPVSGTLSVNDPRFGVVGDGRTDDLRALQRLFDHAARERLRVVFDQPGKAYGITDQLVIRSGARIEWKEPSPITFIGRNTRGGGMLTNMDMDSDNYPVSPCEDVEIINAHLDGNMIKGENGFGFARGARNIHIDGGVFRNLPYSPKIAGGKAVMFEQGVFDCTAGNFTAINCATAAGSQGRTGKDFVARNRRLTSTRSARNIRFHDIRVENCESVCMFFGFDTPNDGTRPMSQEDMSVTLERVTAVNCCVAGPTLDASEGRGAILVLSGAAFCNLSDISVDNAGYNTPVESLMNIWGKNNRIERVTFKGDCNSLINFSRSRAFVDVGGQRGQIYASDILIQDLKHTGSCQTLVDCQKRRGRAVDLRNITIRGLSFDTVRGQLVDPSLPDAPGTTLELVDSRSGKTLSGSVQQMISNGRRR